MHARCLLSIIVFLSTFAESALADDRDKLVGTWKLLSAQNEYQASGEKEFSRGRNPTGSLIFTREGRMLALLTNEARQPAKTDPERADLFNTMVAYAGEFRVEGERWVTKVDIAWSPALVGTEQQRTYRLDGDRLQEITPWGPRPEKGMARAVLMWQRVR